MTKPDVRPTVYVVGAGPGAPDLITIRGKELLEHADLVLYAGSLVNPEILRFCRPECKTVDSAPLNLDEQVQTMVDAARNGKTVVRLHTGDPSLYGAVAEQKALLEREGLRVRFVPGVSSLQAAASVLGIQYTVPGETQTLICTRRTGRTPVPQSETLPALAAHEATMVLFLSSKQAGRVTQDLMDGGLSPETPAACVYRATWPDQVVLRSDLRGLAHAMEDRGIDRHALMVVGRCLNPEGTTSLLYDSSFSHRFRKAKS
ncbi:MAG: precorrin-4 C(11)-methyltransferase [Dethiosulfovibrio peptidovorans]|nr:MAG: precorrin-4 C(11)-methyltransferase [Dethiosulfovibrio peptidovorans]